MDKMALAVSRQRRNHKWLLNPYRLMGQKTGLVAAFHFGFAVSAGNHPDGRHYAATLSTLVHFGPRKWRFRATFDSIPALSIGDPLHCRVMKPLCPLLGPRVAGVK